MRVNGYLNFLTIFLIFTPIFSNAEINYTTEPAVEIVGANSLSFRGQGASPWCFAFAEEQVLKDKFCSGEKCLFNADQWAVSVLDIAQNHGFKNYNHEEKDQSMVMQHFRGSSLSFPYLEDATYKLRDPKCTLDKALFKMNRSKAFNPYRYGLPNMLLEIKEELAKDSYSEKSIKALLPIYQQILEDPQTTPEVLDGVKSLIESAKQRLEMLKDPNITDALKYIRYSAEAHTDNDDYIFSVMNTRICNDHITLPRVQKVEQNLIDEAEIRMAIETGLNHGTLFIGVCAEVLVDQKKVNDEACGAHAVALKSQKANEYLIVDSAFFSPNTKNKDGSQWINKTQVHQAMIKMGKVIKKAKANLRDANHKVMLLHAEQIYLGMIAEADPSVEFSEALDYFFKKIETLLKQVRPSEFQRELLNYLAKWEKDVTKDPQTANDTRELNLTDSDELVRQVIKFVVTEKITNLADLTKVKEFAKKIHRDDMNKGLKETALTIAKEFYGQTVNIHLGGNLVWLEDFL